jgi:hypothetical protein
MYDEYFSVILSQEHHNNITTEVSSKVGKGLNLSAEQLLN